MKHPRVARILAGAAAMLVLAGAADAAGQRTTYTGGAITLAVDARDVVHRVYHVRERIPVRPGPLILYYPQWLPGHHSPSGLVSSVAGLRILAGDRPVAWRRDEADMFAFHLDVPADSTTIDVDFDVVLPQNASQGRVVTSADMLLLEWDTVVLYPAGPPAAMIPVTASASIPAGWRAFTSLKGQTDSSGEARFDAVPLTTLIDSPVLAGEHGVSVDASPAGGGRISLDIVAEGRPASAPDGDKIALFRNLAAQADLLFGGRPFDDYHFLIGLSDTLGKVAWEHQRSNELVISSNFFSNWDASPDSHATAAHEFIHAWIGKYRRHQGEIRSNYQQPYVNDLLWYYEGLTDYYTTVLAARSGLLTAAQARQGLADKAAAAVIEPGRQWRPLSDTTNEAIINPFHVKTPWPSYQRQITAYYSESVLIWLEADALIRTRTNGRKSLDTAIRLLFTGLKAGKPGPIALSEDELYAALNSAAPNDWRGFFAARIKRPGAPSPVAGLDAAGWRLSMEDGASATPDPSQSIGLAVGDDGAIRSVVWGSPAFNAGIAPRARILGVGDLAFSPRALRQAIIDSPTSKSVRLTIEMDGRIAERDIAYAGGPKAPHLVRNESVPDMLATILTPAR